MKSKLLFSTAFLTAMLAGCSNEDPTINDGNANVNGGEDVGGEKSYLTVNIMSPAGSRAEGDLPFENGTAAESKAEKAVFLFYDENGSSTQSPQEVTLDWNPHTESTSPQVEKISQATVVIAGSKEPSQMIAILNPPENYYAAVNGYSAATVRSLRKRYDAHGDGQFLMTNSVYVETKKTNDDGTTTDLPEAEYYEVFTTDIKGKAQKTVDDAKDNAVNVYVERTVAKVRTNKLPEGFAKGAKAGSSPTAADNLICGKEIIQEINGIEIANLAKSTFLLKDITGWQDWDWSHNGTGNKYDWNDPANKRCYWTTTPGSLEFENLSWNDISTSMKGSATNPNFRDPNSKAQTFYVLPNTHPTVNSAVLLTATIKDKATGEPLNFVRWGGNYYLVGDEPQLKEEDGSLTPNPNYEGFLTQYAVMLYGHGYRVEYYDATNNQLKQRAIRANELSWITNDEHEAYTKRTGTDKFEAYETTAKLETKNIPGYGTEEGLKLVKPKKDGSGYEALTDVSEINKTLCMKENRVWMWKGGKCYYYVDIAHFGPNKTTAREEQKVVTTDFSKGIVRNHIYDLNLQSLSGLGTPVFNPDEVIIPQKPIDDLYYLAAKLNILKWRVVQQNVNFNDTESY